jgi:putative ABC transport system permease protein
MTSIRQDIVYGIRTLLDRPAFTLIAVLSLALGIAVNTTIFSILNATVFGSMGFEDEDELVAIATYPLDSPSARNVAAYREYAAWRSAGSFQDVGVLVPGDNVRNLGASTDGVVPAEQLEAVRVDPAMFRTLRLRPQLGRLFTDDEDQVDNAAPVVLLTDRFWEQRYGRDPGAIGQTLRLDGVVHTIIGVMPPDEESKLFQPSADLWVPSSIVTAQAISDARFVVVFARLAEGVSIRQAQTELDGMALQFAEDHPSSNENTGFRVMTITDFIFNDAATLLFTLQGAVGFVLLIACANVAGLMLARATARQREIAIRSAVGAVRTRLVRQVLTESAVLSVFGGALGVFLAWGGLKVFVRAAPTDVPNLNSMTISPEVLVFTGVIVVLTAILFGIVPAWQGSRADLTSLLNESSRGSSGGAARQRLRMAMVAGQTGLALILLIAAGLLINSFARVQDNDLGADPDGILTFRLQFSQDETITFTGEQVEGVGLWRVSPAVGLAIDRLYQQLQLVPGIESVAAVNVPPFQGAVGRTFEVFGRTPEEGEAQGAAYLAVTPGYFETLGVDLRRGRVFDERDTQDSPKVVVINESMARRFWEDADPIGDSLTLDYVPGEPPRQVVGIVGDVLLSQFAEDAAPIMYVPLNQQTELWRGPQWGLRAATYFLVRGRGDPLSLIPDLQRAATRVDPDRPITEIRTIDQYLTEQMQGNSLIVALLAIFGAIAGALAVSGIYGVISYAVSQRTNEIGIRMALGASGARIVALIMRQAVVVVLIGLVIGVIGAFALTRLLGNALVGIEATDPLTFAAVTLMLLAAALVACVVPTWRALKIDPSEALRYE